MMLVNANIISFGFSVSKICLIKNISFGGQKFRYVNMSAAISNASDDTLSFGIGDGLSFSSSAKLSMFSLM